LGEPSNETIEIRFTEDLLEFGDDGIISEKSACLYA
jgi:hypothetical protein